MKKKRGFEGFSTSPNDCNLRDAIPRRENHRLPPGYCFAEAHVEKEEGLENASPAPIKCNSHDVFPTCAGHKLESEGGLNQLL